MSVLLDTTGMASAERARAMEEFVGASLPMRFDCSRPLEQMHSWSGVWNLGSIRFLQSRGAGMRGIRGKREVDASPVPAVTLAYSVHGVTTGRQGSREYVLQPEELMLLDMTEPYDMVWRDGFSAFALQLTQAELGVSGDVTQHALRHLRESPVYDLVRRHIGRMCAALPSLTDNPAGQALGGVTLDLVRALVASAGGEAAQAAEVLRETRPARIEHWITEHLSEQSLSAEQIAAAHYMSVRQLYYVWAARQGETLAEWIVSQRLERAARILTEPTGADVPIAAVARRCGFADPPHFTRRFRGRYGVTPRDWRALHRRGTLLVDAPPAHG